MKPLRRKTESEVTRDPKTGKERILVRQEEQVVLSDAGSVDTTSVTHRSFLDCGCSASSASCCYECGALSCQLCQGHCQKCLKPICLEHSNILEVEGQSGIRLCSNCYNKAKRKRIWAKVGGFFLSLFAEDQNDE